MDPAELRARFPRVAIVHDWLTVPGGSETCVLEMLELLSHAEIFTTVYDPAPWPRAITDRPVHASFLNRIPGAVRHYPKLLPLMNAAFARFDFSGFDLVISSSHACAKNVKVPAGTLHVCYCYTPMRYAWDPAFMAQEDLGRATRTVMPLLLRRLRRRDLEGAARLDEVIAISDYVAARIQRHWRRGARVIYPPVQVRRYLDVPRSADDYYLVLGRIVPYKRVDLAVAACARLGRRVLVAGDGRAMPAARAAAGPGAEFLGRVPDEDLPGLLAGARALLFPGEEDFGIVPVEAQAAGTPVIAYGVGGAHETVRDGETGVLFQGHDVDAMTDAIRRFEALDLDPQAARENALRFSPERFRKEITDVITDRERVAA